MLSKIAIRNYRGFRSFDLDFRDGLNILVGVNESGKSTVLEAVSLALTGRLADKAFAYALSPHICNQDATTAYVEGIRAGQHPAPPEIVIDLFLEPSDETAALRGTNNVHAEDAPGLRVRAYFDDRFGAEYAAFIGDGESVGLVPTEYYRVDWVGFSGNPVTRRGVPIAMSKIDASSIRLQSGADYYLQQIVQEHLDPIERVELARAYRSLRERFSDNEAITTINDKLAVQEDGITDRALSLSIDISQRTAWETSLIPHLDDLPFQFVGSGMQSMLKTLLALNRSADEANVILIEEPENHLAPGALNALVQQVAARCEGKQLLLTTHSSYVLNKLGLDQLVLLHGEQTTTLADLPADTLAYFKRLPGYDTLRLVLSKRAILVEGPSDELVVQRAYFDVHGMLPLQAEVDVIAVRGLSFKRFLDIALRLDKPVVVVTDNDSKSAQEIEERYSAYLGEGSPIKVFAGPEELGASLEQQLVSSAGRETLNAILGRDDATDEELVAHMQADKTAAALAIFESDTAISMPGYIDDAVRS